MSEAPPEWHKFLVQGGGGNLRLGLLMKDDEKSVKRWQNKFSSFPVEEDKRFFFSARSSSGEKSVTHKVNI